MDSLESIQFAQRLGLLKHRDAGPSCGRKWCDREHMTMCRDETIDGFKWRCNGTIRQKRKKRKRCLYGCSIRRHTIFDSSKLPIWKILLFVRQWCKQTILLKDVADIIGLSLATATHWGSFCHEVVADGMIFLGEKLGGKDAIVEIYESKFGR